LTTPLDFDLFLWHYILTAQKLITNQPSSRQLRMEDRILQIIALIERSERILLCTHRKPDGDAVGSIMGLYKALNLLGKEVTATCADQLPEHFQFLPEIGSLHQEVPGNRDFVVTLDCDKTEVDRLKYHLEDNKIHIVITPKKGRFFEKNVSCEERSDHFDLIITVDVADVSQLGKLYEDNLDLFTSVPVINIDHHISNPGFGKINLIDVAASSTAEILHGLIREMERHFGKTLIVPETATFLLSGVTTDTGSFQNANTTPKSMEVAADLIDAGANQQDIIKYLFRTKKLTTLKLWGRILTKIEVDDAHRIVWSSITQQDLRQTGAHMDEVGEIIDELLVHAPEAEIVVLFKEDPDIISVSFRSTIDRANVMEIAQKFGGGGHVRASGAKIKDQSLAQVMNSVLAEIQSYQAERLGLKSSKFEVRSEEKGKITQVLDGYTPVGETVKPTLEERAQGKSENRSSKFEVRSSDKTFESKQPTTNYQLPTTPPADIHTQTKAAIQAEQRMPADAGFKPSQATAQQERPKPVPEKRFDGQRVPEFLKKGTEEPKKPEEKKDEGVTVKFDQTAVKPPEIPKTSVEPTVKPAPSTQPPSSNPMTPQSLQTPQTPQTPPPKDPFAQGDDGLTDIERALGGL